MIERGGSQCVVASTSLYRPRSLDESKDFDLMIRPGSADIRSDSLIRQGLATSLKDTNPRSSLANGSLLSKMQTVNRGHE